MLLLVAATDRELCGHEGLVCGVGPVEAAAATARALALGEVRALVHVGIAGARGYDVGTLVVGSEAVYCDVSTRWPVIDRVDADPRLAVAAVAALPGAATAPIHTSAAVGGASEAVPDGPLVEAMEGFGVLRAAALARVPAIEVRAISNEIGEDDRSGWAVREALAALEHAIPLLAAAAAAAP